MLAEGRGGTAGGAAGRPRVLAQPLSCSARRCQLKPDVEASPGPHPVPPVQRVRKVSVRWCFSLYPIKPSCVFPAFLFPPWLPQVQSQIFAMLVTVPGEVIPGCW